MKNFISLILMVFFCLASRVPIFCQDIDYVNSIFWSEAYDVEISGNYAFCGFANGLMILDISNPNTPVIVSKILCQNPPKDIVVEGNYAYLAESRSFASWYGLEIVDISNPALPVIVCGLETERVITAIEKSGEYLYLAFHGFGMMIFDVSNPGNPTLTGTYESSDSYRITDILVAGDHAFLTDVEGYGLLILDVSIPENPVYTAHLDTPDRIQNICVSGDYVYAAATDSGMQVISIADFENPTLIGELAIEGHTRRIFYYENNAYLQINGPWPYYKMLSIDIDNPDEPAIIGECELEAPVYGFYIADGYAFIAEGFSGIEIVNVADPQVPVVENVINSYGPLYDVFIAGDYAYVANGYDNNLTIVDISDSSNPIVAGNLEFEWTPVTVYVLGDYAYVGCMWWDWEGNFCRLHAVDISDPNNPILMGSLDNAGNSIFATEAFVYVTGVYGMETDFQVINVSDPENPESIATYAMPNYANDVHIAGNYAFVADQGSVNIMDISEPTNPALIGSFGSFTAGIFVSSHYAYLANGVYGFQIFDIEDPEYPVPLGILDTPSWAADVVVSGDYAYVADQDSGIVVIDVSNPEEPILVGSYDTPGKAGNVFVSGESIYVADFYSLIMLQFDPETGIEEIADIPNQYSLSQNYPNPFNKSTSINYSIPHTTEVTINIYDVLGREVVTLHDGMQQPGRHSVTWNADNISTGLYFYTIQAGDYTEKKKMLLLK